MEEDKNKFILGDKVRIVKYGHPIWYSKEQYPFIDLMNKQFFANFTNKLFKENIIKEPEVDYTAKPNNIIGESGTHYTVDTTPEIVGKEGIIVKSERTQGIPSYAVDGIPEKYAWYDENQLELISRHKI